MARGWESKSVEAQQAEATTQNEKGRVRLTHAEAAQARERENLRLSRQSVLQQLEKATDPRHRQQLQDAVAGLDQKLEQLKR
jgi:hypothetical protein